MNDYMIVLKGGFENWSTKPEAEKKEVMSHFAQWAKHLIDKGHYKDCVRPEPMSESRRVTMSANNVVVDGPFSETKELISGAFFVKAKDISEATELAKLCPVLKFGGSVDVFTLAEDR
jgi:hypothetical protein